MSMDILCAHCEHPLSSHDGYGCGKWLAQKHAAKMCPCDWSRRQLLEIDRRHGQGGMAEACPGSHGNGPLLQSNVLFQRRHSLLKPDVPLLSTGDPMSEWHCPNCQITNSGHVDECVRCGHDRPMNTCESTKEAKYGLPPWRCEKPAGHDGPHAEGLPMPVPGQVGFVYTWGDE